MSAIRICFVAAVILTLSACRRGDIPLPPPGEQTLGPPFPVNVPAQAAVSNSSKQPVPAQPTGKPVAPAPPRPAPAAGPAPRVTTPVAPPVARPPTPAAPRVAAPSAPPASLTLDLDALKQQLRETKAIGFFSKIALKNQVDDLMKQFREHYKGKAKVTMPELRQSYNLLMMKVLSLVQDDDQKLASAIVSSREAIWDLLADPKKFAALDG